MEQVIHTSSQTLKDMHMFVLYIPYRIDILEYIMQLQLQLSTDIGLLLDRGTTSNATVWV